MDDNVNAKPSPPTIQFPVTLNHHHEMDFFADKKDNSHSKVTENTTADVTDNNNKDSSLPTNLNFNVNTGLRLLTGNTSSDQSIVDDGVSSNSDDKRAKTVFAVLQDELETTNTENQRLRDMLNQVTNNYSTLQMHLVTLMHQQAARSVENRQQMNGGGVTVPRKFMDLGLAATAENDEASLSSSDGGDHFGSPAINNGEGVSKEFNNGEGSTDQGSQVWGPNKVPRFSPTKSVDQATEATIRKARVSVRARSEAPMITDGCQWRKYGQKMAKGNPCPRAYYRCTMAAGCPVRKQVQRCAEDRTILITTYEGNHNHPLPPAAMAMASTTSSAARMLLSGSMPSADGLINSNFLARTLLPCSSNMATISASAPFPTVTLDLTKNPNPLQFQRPQTQFQLPFANPAQNLAGSPAALLPQIFGQALYNQSKFSGLQMSQDMESATQLGHQLPAHHQVQPGSLADTVTALTSDPSFSAALAAAISSIIGSSHQNNNNTNVTTTTSNNNGSVTTSNNSSAHNNKVSHSSFSGK